MNGEADFNDALGRSSLSVRASNNLDINQHLVSVGRN
jgi:hypothetical protein